MVDAEVSKTSCRKAVPVRVRPRAPQTTTLTMSKIALAVALVLSSTELFAANHRSIDDRAARVSERIARSRHYTFRPDRALTAAERAALRASGVEITRPAADGGYVVRVPSGRAVDARFEALTAERKIHRKALREAASGRSMAKVNVFFHDDVPFEAALNLVVSAGGVLRDPFQLGYLPMSRIPVTVPSTSVRTLAGDERVVLIHGPVSLPQANDNYLTAQLSNVDDLYAAPYGLDGSGVSISFFELAPALASHAEFGGRLTVHDVSGSATGSNADHATHVAGTLGAAGTIQSTAKGMAPAVTLHEFDANDDGDFGVLLARKEKLPDVASVADSNSWGYVLGWCGAPSCNNGWVWDETSEYYGGYDAFFSAPLDRVARDTDVLMVHSAGNDADKLGPLAPPFSHKHGDDKDHTYCYSPSGSGTDCPATPCSVGAKYCEKTRHPQLTSQLPAPWISIGIIASAKNVLSVGAVNSSKQIADFSSRGPTRDGRIKPEIVARGVTVYSTLSNGQFGNKSGTSMATPAVTGTAALLTQQWRKLNPVNPRPEVLKSLLIAGVEDLGNPGPDYTFGFGLMDAKVSADLIIADGGRGRRVKNGTLTQGATFEVPVTITTPQRFRAVLTWRDPEVLIFADDDFAASALVNDLDVKLVDASGQETLPYVLNRLTPDAVATRGVNTIDNIEMVEITNAPPGLYRLVVSGTRITAGPNQSFALVASGELAADAIPCVDNNEPNNAEGSASPLSFTAATGRACAAGDVDFFQFTATKTGPVSVTVTATGTPLRVTLTSNGITVATTTVAAGATATLNANVTSQPATYFVRIEPNGAIGEDASYTVTASYPVDATRRRAVRR